MTNTPAQRTVERPLQDHVEVFALALNLPSAGSRILLLLFKNCGRCVPHHELFCHACKKSFSKVLSPVDYEKGEALCPHCGSKEVEQCRSAFFAISSKKSA